MQTNYLKALFIVLLLIAFTNCVYAENQSHDATIGKIDTPSIYDVDIKWDNMSFIFVEQEKYVYESDTNSYKRNIEKYWTSSSNNINIKNKSSKEIKVSLKFQGLNRNVNGTFSKNNFNMKSLEEQNIKLNLTGNIDSSYNIYKTVGEISIIVS